MKNLIKLIYLVLCTLVPIISKAQNAIDAGKDSTIVCGERIQLTPEASWTALGSGTTQTLHKVCYTNEQTAFVVGDSGIILKTINKGNSFTVLSSGTTQSLRSICFPSGQIGYVCGNQGTVLKTQNAGSTWVSLSTGQNVDFADIFFVNDSLGFAVGNNATLIKTTDGGQNWTLQSTGKTWSLNLIHFLDANTGFALGSGGGILKTTNGGQTWTEKFSFSPSSYYSISFTSHDTAYVSGVAGVYFVLRTTNCGETWTAVNNNSYYGPLYFTNKNTCYLLGGNIKKSTDAAGTFETLPLAPLIGVKSGAFYNELVAMAVGYNGGIWRHEMPDSCRWWPAEGLSDSSAIQPYVYSTASTTYFLTAKVNGSIQTDNVTIFVSPLEVNAGTDRMAVCGDTLTLNASSNFKGSQNIKYKWFPSTGLNNDSILNPKCLIQTGTKFILLAKTLNGCEAYDTLQVALNFNLNAGPDKTIFCSNEVQLNLQSSWNSISSGTINNLSAVEFINKDTGFICANNTLLRSKNSGGNWEALSTGGSYFFYDIQFVNQQTGYASAFNSMSMSGTLIKTSNGGNSWTNLTLGGNYQVPKIFFTGELTGFAIANPGKIIRTVNGGTSWIVANTNTTQQMNSLFFTSASVGYAVGNAGTILKTTNAGISWIALNSNLTNDLKSVYFTSQDTGFVGGTHNTILRTYDGGLNWVAVPANINTYYDFTCNAMWFKNAQTGYSVHSYYRISPPQMNQPGAVFVTYNSGATWSRMLADSSYAFNDICFNTNNMGYIVGNNGTLVMTSQIPDSYQWFPGTGLNNPNIANPIAKPIQTTQYLVNGIKANCLVRDTVLIIVKPLTINAGTDKQVVCGDSALLLHQNVYVKIDASRFYSKWTLKNSNNQILFSSSPDSVFENYITLPDGQYTLYIRPYVIPPPLSFTIKPFAGDSLSETIYSSPDTLIIRTFTVNSLSKYHFTWWPAQSLIGSNSAPKTYYLNMVSDEGCTASDSMVIIPQALKVNAGTDKQLVCGGLIRLDTLKSNYSGVQPLNIQWYPSTGIQDTNHLAPLLRPNQSTSYRVEINTANGCIARDTLQVIVNPLTVSGFDRTGYCNDTLVLNAVSNYTGPDMLNYTWSPNLNLDSANKKNPVLRALRKMPYQVKIYDNFGCSATDSVYINLLNPVAENICLVSVSDENRNVIILNKTNKVSLDSIFFWKETNTTGNYNLMGGLNYQQVLLYTDSNSQVWIQSNKYKIQSQDICGLRSDMSAPHKTMHLTINKGLGNTWNLIWEAYEGFTVQSYNVYRGNHPDSLFLIGTSSGSNSSYTDLSAPGGDLVYQVELISPQNCFPGKTYNSSRSNKASTKLIGLSENQSKELNFRVYPNPGTEQIRVETQNFDKEMLLVLYDMQGKIQLQKTLTNTGESIDISGLAAGLYLIQITDQNKLGTQRWIKN